MGTLTLIYLSGMILMTILYLIWVVTISDIVITNPSDLIPLILSALAVALLWPVVIILIIHNETTNLIEKKGKQ